MFLHYLKIAWRNIVRSKFRYLFMAVSLAIGMVVVTFTLYMVFQERRTFTQFDNYDRIAELSVLTTTGSSRVYSHPFNQNMINGFLQKGTIPGVTKISIFRKSEGVLDFEKEQGSFFPFSAVMGNVNKDFFDVFSAKFIFGNCNIWNEREAVITQRFAEKIYGKENPIGKAVLYENNYYHITGVIKEYSSPGIVSADIYIPIHVQQNGIPYALLDKNADIGFVNNYLIHKQIIPEERLQGGEFKLRIVSEREYDGFEKFLLTLIIITSILILLAAFINSLNLSVNSLMSRNREIILRKTMGASYKSIWVTAMLTDLFVLVFAFLTATSLSELLIGSINSGIFSLNIKGLWIESHFVFLFLVGVFAVLIISAIIFTSIASYRIANPVTLQGSLHRRNQRSTRRALLITQLSICFLFVGITLGLHLHYKNFFREYNQSMNIGSRESDRILKLDQLISGSTELWENREAIMTEIGEIREVENILHVPHYTILPSQVKIKLNQEDDETKVVTVLNTSADKNYFSFFELTQPGDSGLEDNNRTVFINEAFARMLYGYSSQNSFYEGDRLVNISHVIDDLPFIPNNQPGYLEIINDHFQMIYIKCAPGKTKSALRKITDIVHDYVPEYPLRIEPFREEINSRTNNINQIRDIFLLLGVISLIISMFGIYSAIVTDTQRRQKEVAIRKVNGARIKDILHLFGKFYVKLLFASLVIAFPFFLFGLQVIGMTYGESVSIWNLPFWVGLVITVAGFVFITVVWRMWRTARVNPAGILKKE